MTRQSSVSALRFLKFSLVGGIGIGVQLAALTGLTAIRVNYLLAAGLAVESAIVHNFLWHLRFTWADRAIAAPSGAGRPGAIEQLLRFQLTNGSISLAGNLLLMRLLVGFAGLSVRRGSLLSIALCAGANFLACDRWVFWLDRDCGAAPTAATRRKQPGASFLA
jgi:putative flippase GtrA